MSDRADKLLTRIVGAWDANVHVGLCAALDAARAYLNEKPHEPIKDANMVESGHVNERLSPPHAAAECNCVMYDSAQCCPIHGPRDAAAEPPQWGEADCIACGKRVWAGSMCGATFDNSHRYAASELPAEVPIDPKLGVAAAEPEKPVAWYMPLSGRHAMIEWGAPRPDAGNIGEWRPLYASPSAQPIAREPPPDDSQLAGDVAYLRAKNDPRLFDIANQLIYCWAQDGLLSKAQAERDKFRDELAETKRPLDDQMRRLNDRVIELNDENLRLRRIAAHVPGLVYITAKERAGYGVAVLPTDAALQSAGKEST